MQELFVAGIKDLFESENRNETTRGQSVTTRNESLIMS